MSEFSTKRRSVADPPDLRPPGVAAFVFHYLAVCFWAAVISWLVADHVGFGLSAWQVAVGAFPLVFACWFHERDWSKLSWPQRLLSMVACLAIGVGLTVLPRFFAD